MARSFTMISGYYGFDNLGDEAILEQLIADIRATSSDRIIVLSQDPEATRKKFAVESINRWNLLEISVALLNTRLFVSGGGGLFQDTGSLKSIVYYGGLLIAARLAGAKTLIYAQGVGPLKRDSAIKLTSRAFRYADQIVVRDYDSQNLVQSWGLSADMTADPVWCLNPSSLPVPLKDALKGLEGSHLVGLSLRSGAGFGARHLTALVDALEKTLKPESKIILLPLQDVQDKPMLNEFKELWQKKERTAIFLPTEHLTLPSQWLSLFDCLDLMVGMRLHALIMTLACGKPVVGIAYDPKVEKVLVQFQQPSLPFTKTDASENQDNKDTETWPDVLKEALQETQTLSNMANRRAMHMRGLACQNREFLARIHS